MDACIKAISYYLPEQLLTNEELVSNFPEWSIEKIAQKVGILQRHISATGETAGDMAEKAALNLFNEYNISPSEVDFILFCTQSPDYFIPTTACILQDRLGIPVTAGAIDYNLGCSGYVYGLSIAKGLIYAGISKNILLLTAETYTKHIHPKDKGNRTLFGDGASATLISTTGFATINNFSLGTDGKGAENLMVKTGGFRFPDKLNDAELDESGTLISSDHLYMDGSEIFNFTLTAVPQLVNENIKANNIEQDDVDLFIFHQANKFMLSSLRKLIGIDRAKFYHCLENTGNTVSSTIPIALKEALKDGSVTSNNKVMLVGFGVGYSWGACLLEF